uniref:Nucleotide-diphospho-sugar transferase domain-containing protein n=2 Tax=Caenorhabditis tropicalis TaxID=1561998 RepID=A0A1I7V479_9PELO
MKKSMRGPFLFILGVTFSGFLFSIHYTRDRDYDVNLVENPGPFVDLSDTEKNSKEIVFVSAVSDNHFNEATTSISAFFKFNPNGKFILYSLGLNELYINNVKKDFKNLEVREFDTTGYPDYTRTWMEYRFKPLILAEVMKEFSNIWWMDAHIVVKKPKMIELLYKGLAENVKSEVPIYFLFIQAIPILPHYVLTYFPTNSIDLLKNEKRGFQLGANTFFVARTEYTVEVFKWWILCALDKTCMAPPGAQVYCKFGKDRNNEFAKCFRFDQSILNLLLLNNYQDANKYLINIGYLF